MTTEALQVSDPKFSPKTGMMAKDRADIADALGVVLADSYMIFIKTQGVHWNVSGPAFFSIHKLTQAQYENIYAAIDKIAERIRALGAKAPASYTKYGELSEIRDDDSVQTAQAMLEMLVADHEGAVTNMRKAVGRCEDKKDFVTADLLISRMAWHEQAVWMLRSISAS